ncbi:FecR family protein [Sphingobium sp. DN12]|uniref:FecR family protein n=1 Tax=Sphingobium sp. DN12 TaxID=3378073 RepID=UPI003DA630BE
MSIRPSAVTIEIRSTDRRIRLLKGEALFTVAPDRSRPFTVQAAIGETMALGTQFSVRRTGADTEVTVTEHSVMLVSGEGKGASLILREGQSVDFR